MKRVKNTGKVRLIIFKKETVRIWTYFKIKGKEMRNSTEEEV